MATLVEQLDAMLTLPANWDGYNAGPIQPGPVEVAKEIVRFFETLIAQFGPKLRDIRVYPTRVGGVQIEWEDDLQEVELEIYPDGKMSFLFEEKGSGRMTERVVEPGTGAVQPGFLSQLRHVIAA
jgi:hypothetical protein